MIFVVVLQNCMGFVESETGSCIETCVTCDVDGSDEISIKDGQTIDVKDEVSIKVEEAIDIKDEFPGAIKDGIPEAVTFPSIKTECEVRQSCREESVWNS